MSPSCHTLSKALDISRNIPLISLGGLQSKDAKISWTISNWYSHESEGRKPDWLSQRRQFFWSYSKMELNKIFSKTLPKIGTSETDDCLSAIKKNIDDFWPKDMTPDKFFLNLADNLTLILLIEYWMLQPTSFKTKLTVLQRRQWLFLQNLYLQCAANWSSFLHLQQRVW